MTIERNVYLKMETLENARRIFLDRFQDCRMPAEPVDAVDALDRVLAEPVFAHLSSPGFHAAAMDGIAVAAARTFGASDGAPRTLTVGIDAFWVNTGHVLPAGTDAVIMIEHIHRLDETRIAIEAPAFPWQHVRKIGEDIVATELLFSRNHRITPYCVGALLSAGVFRVVVRRRPRLLIIPTGSELVDWREAAKQPLRPGQVIETNAHMLGRLAQRFGAEFVRHEKVMDDLEQIQAAVTQALEGNFDMVLTVGGSSAGSQDFAKMVITALGDVLVHGVTIMPGKPVILGSIKDKPVVGIPGYPVSAIVAFEQLVAPLICQMLGQPDVKRPTVEVIPARKVASKLGVEEFLRVKLGRVGNQVVATPLARGAGSITTLTEANGIIRIANHIEGLKDGQPVTAELLRPLSSVDNTIVVVGSHDNTLDLLSDQIRTDHSHLSLSSSHVGSMGGLMAIKRGVCHVAGTHLLDIRDGSYNVSYIRRYLPGVPVKLVHLVYRDQGLMIPKANPKKIRGIEDLAGGKLRFINRQAGSGTRILLDYRLQQLGIDPAAVTGYDTEEFTHMSVAVAVLSGAADVGLGIAAAARALDLAFVPVVTEQYDLVIPEPFFETENIQILLDTIHSAAFKQRVEALGGYSTRRTGEVLPLD
jgi:putative molybdopterin biosynthesis protein